MDDIRKWLNNSKEYNSGVHLYVKHGKDPLLLKLFTAESYSEFKHDKLKKALESLLNPNSQEKALVKVNIPTHPKVAFNANKTAQNANKVAPDAEKIELNPDLPKIIDHPKGKWSEKRDDIENSLFESWKPLHSEMLDLQAHVGDLAREGIKDTAKKEKAGQMALRILQLDKLCEQIYFKRNYYLEHNRLPKVPTIIKLSIDPLQWPKKLANHERYCREFKKRLAKDPSNTDIAELLQKHEWAVKEYKKKLNIDHE